MSEIKEIRTGANTPKDCKIDHLALATELWKADPIKNHRQVLKHLFHHAVQSVSTPANERAALRLLESVVQKLHYSSFIDSTRLQLAASCLEQRPRCGSPLSAAITSGSLRSMTLGHAVLLQTILEVGAKNLTFTNSPVADLTELLGDLLRFATSNRANFQHMQSSLKNPELRPGLEALLDWWHANRATHNLPCAIRVALAVAFQPIDPERAAQILRPALEHAGQPCASLSDSSWFSFEGIQQLSLWSQGRASCAFLPSVSSTPTQDLTHRQARGAEELLPHLARLEDGLPLDSEIFASKIAPNFERLGIKQKYFVLQSANINQLQEISSEQLVAVRDHYVEKCSPVKGLISILKCRELGIETPLHESRFLYDRMSDLGFYRTLKILKDTFERQPRVAADYGARVLATYCIVAASQRGFKLVRSAYEIARDCGISIPLPATFYCLNRAYRAGAFKFGAALFTDRLVPVSAGSVSVASEFGRKIRLIPWLRALDDYAEHSTEATVDIRQGVKLNLLYALNNSQRTHPYVREELAKLHIAAQSPHRSRFLCLRVFAEDVKDTERSAIQEELNTLLESKKNKNAIADITSAIAQLKNLD